VSRSESKSECYGGYYMRSQTALVIAILLVSTHAIAKNQGQWESTDADVRRWYRDLRQPDNQFQSCCGEADAYWADSYFVSGDNYVAIITDERDHATLGRIPRSAGDRFVVPNAKIKFDAGNPTGHGVIFIGADGRVLCYVPPGGV
jgi:hypothetical protein